MILGARHRRHMGGNVKHARMPKMVRVLACVAVAIFFLQPPAVAAPEDDIVLAPKNFFDNGDAVVGISGTLTGDGLTYSKNNTVVVVCYKDRSECLTYSIEQAGRNQMGRLDYPIIYPITTWNAREVTATEAVSSVHCRKTTISLERKRETAVWVEEPINQTRAICKDAQTKIFKWTIEDPPVWKAMRERRK
jgi:hypothetical protein